MPKNPTHTTKLLVTQIARDRGDTYQDAAISAKLRKTDLRHDAKGGCYPNREAALVDITAACANIFAQTGGGKIFGDKDEPLFLSLFSALNSHVAGFATAIEPSVSLARAADELERLGVLFQRTRKYELASSTLGVAARALDTEILSRRHRNGVDMVSLIVLRDAVDVDKAAEGLHRAKLISDNLHNLYSLASEDLCPVEEIYMRNALAEERIERHSSHMAYIPGSYYSSDLIAAVQSSLDPYLFSFWLLPSEKIARDAVAAITAEQVARNLLAQGRETDDAWFLLRYAVHMTRDLLTRLRNGELERFAEYVQPLHLPARKSVFGGPRLGDAFGRRRPRKCSCLTSPDQIEGIGWTLSLVSSIEREVQHGR